MRILSIDEIREFYRDYLLDLHKDWNKPGTKTDTAKQRVSDTLYLWNNGDKMDYWYYISGQKDRKIAYATIKRLLATGNAPKERQEGYCQMFDEFCVYFDLKWGGIIRVIDDNNVEVREISKHTKYKRLSRICVSDNISFQYNYEVLNACFGAKLTSSLQQATWDPKDGCLVWFPHEARLENGKYLPGSSQVNWKNYFKDEGEVIIQMLYPDESVNDDDKEPVLKPSFVPLHTFMKRGERDYRYVGTYMLDYNSSTPRYQVMRRVKDSIDLSIWASGRDTDYFDLSQTGKDVFKKFFIDKNFDKHRMYIENFTKKDTEWAEEEQTFINFTKQFVEQHRMVDLLKMNDVDFVNKFLVDLSTYLKQMNLLNISSEELSQCINGVQEFVFSLYDVLNSNIEVSLNDQIRNSSWGSRLVACIFSIYHNAEEYIYTLSESDIDKILFALGINYAYEWDIVDKQSIIYFWRGCDVEIQEWSIFRYYQFLRFLSGIKKKEIRYISKAKPIVTKQIQEEVRLLETEIEQDSLDDVPTQFQYSSIPRPREININAKPSAGKMIPRHADRKINALVRACYCCEIDKNHPTFLRRNSNKKYTETHHLIPLEFSGQFEFTLDTEENIISLCSNCHNQIHYGEGAEELLRILFEDRKDALKRAGLDRTIDGIIVDFEQLLHMYNLA